MKCFVFFLFAFLTARSTMGVMLLNEPFNYTNGPLITVSGGLWSMHSGIAGQTDITNAQVILTSTQSEDANAPLAGQPYPAAGATNIFYARFIARFSALPTDTGAWFACFKDGGTGYRCRVFALAQGAAPGRFRVGLSTANNSTATVTNGTDILLNTAFVVVIRLANTNSVARLWLNPTDENSPSITTAEALSTFSVAAFALRQNSGMGTLALDNLLVGTSFADVLSASAPIAPVLATSPESQTVAQTSNVVFTSAAAGIPPLRYQWFFNGGLLASATNANLSFTNVGLSQQGDYTVVVTNFLGAVTSAPAALTVTLTATGSTNAAFTILTYNTHGATVGDWTTNSSQVQAIGRQVQFLNPDIITFQEIPITNNGTAEMANFVKAYRPGYYLATNSGTDGFIRSAILSRFPIIYSTKLLDGVSLASFGYAGNFTRDLFEAQIKIPTFPQPLHIFTTHLKSGQGSDETLRRNAEASAISNFFKTSFLIPNSMRPYILTGDMNEDLSDPPSGGAALRTLTSSATGLKVTTPINPFTLSPLTFSIQAANITRRYDYILPSDLLATNITSGYVFRTGLATNIAPALPNDDVTASDHLPVFMAFANPYASRFSITTVTVSNNFLRLTWDTIPGGRYRVEATTNLTSWAPNVTNILATNATLTFVTNAAPTTRFFRVRTEP